jgi:hypothetical protein
VNEAVTNALRRMVNSSESPEELDQRVVQSFGTGCLGLAHQIAFEVKGGEWLERRTAGHPESVQDSNSVHGSTPVPTVTSTTSRTKIRVVTDWLLRAIGGALLIAVVSGGILQWCSPHQSRTDCSTGRYGDC